MKLQLTLSASCILFVALAKPVPAQDLGSRMEQYMAARAALGQFSGAVLVADNGKILLEKGYGFASIEQAVPATPQTKFAAASLTKQFVGFAIQQLRDAHKLALTDSICRFVDSCPAAWQPVTLDHLIHHTSGVPDYESALDIGSLAYARYMLAPNSDDSIIAAARTKPLDFAPGTKFSYSNTAYILLAKVIERVSGASFADYMRANVFEPLGMRSTGIFLANRNVPDLAYGYVPDENVPLNTIVAGLTLRGGPFVQTPVADMTGAHGDGGMYTTVGDLYRWDQALYDPKRATDVAELFRPGLEGYGFGWFVDSAFATTRQWHTGQVPGFLSRIERFPSEKLFVVTMTNTMNSRLSNINRDLEAIALGKPYDVPRSHHIIPRDSASESLLTGDYTLADGRVVHCESGDRYLTISIKGRFTAGLLPEGPRLFYVPFFEGTVKFDGAPNQPPSTLTMHYEGTDRVARRVY
jgi:CubicO group peptidase (beta-lactamase class C family)